MRSKVRTGIICAAITAAVILVAGIALTSNQPIVRVADGGLALDESLPLAEVEGLIVDEANVLSGKTEQIAAIYNANWKEMAGRVMAVVTVNDAGQAEETAWKWYELLSLGGDDALILVETRNGGSCTVVAQGSLRNDFDNQPSGFVSSLTYHTMKNRDFDTAVQNVFTRVHLFHNDYHAAVAQSGMQMGIVITVVVGLLIVVLTVLGVVKLVRSKNNTNISGNRKIDGGLNRPVLGSSRKSPIYSRGGRNGGFGSSNNVGRFGDGR